MTFTIVEPPGYAIMWAELGNAVAETCEPQDLLDLGLGPIDLVSAFLGRPMETLPFLIVCDHMGLSPMAFLAKR